MKELSLNILDIAENSVKAKATLTKILLSETADTLTVSIEDDGCGMDSETLKRVTDPFYTTRTTRSVGMGIPLFKMCAEQTGGGFCIESEKQTPKSCRHGTKITASFNKNHIDFTPLGDITETLITLIQGHPNTDFYFCHTLNGKEITLDTRELRNILGDGVPLNEYEVIKWIEAFVNEQYNL